MDTFILNVMRSLSVAGLRSSSIKLVLVHTPVPLFLVPAPVSPQVPALESVHRTAWSNTIECGKMTMGRLSRRKRDRTELFSVSYIPLHLRPSPSASSDHRDRSASSSALEPDSNSLAEKM